MAALTAVPVAAQEGAIGPCSPYRAADGDVPSEMPGCGPRLRPAPGSLADEVEFRRTRKGAEAGDAAGPDDDPSPVPPRKRPRRPLSR